MWERKRIGVAVFPRQSGKDVAMSMDMCKGLLQTPKSAGVYVAPTMKDIRDIIWDKRYYDPIAQGNIQLLQDNVDSSLVDWKSTLLEGRFTNKSIMKMQGFYQSGKDANGVGTSYQRYAFTELSLFSREDPIPRIMPILAVETEEKKMAAVATPRGKRNNALWKLMEQIKDLPDAQIILRTIDDLNTMMLNAGLPPVLTQETLEREK